MAQRQRVNITVAARLTGRSEKTLRTWLAETPSPLSVEWGQYRGGRRMGNDKNAPVRKGRTRLLDTGELRAVHEARGGTEWHDQFLPVPDVREFVARLEAVEAALAALREHAPYLFRERVEVQAPLSSGASGARSTGDSAAEVPAVPAYAPPVVARRQRPSSASANRSPLPPLPDGWVAAIECVQQVYGAPETTARRWVRGEDKRGRPVQSRKVPEPHTGDWSSGPAGGYVIHYAYDEEQQREVARRAGKAAAADDDDHAADRQHD